MPKWMAVLLCSVLWLSPLMAAAGESGQPTEQRPEQRVLLSKDNLRLVQERLKAEGVDPGPADGVLNPQTEAALRAYQQKQGLPITGAPDEATLRQLQIRIVPGGAGGER
jgi:peptidoglycan hydrolase-like protein with peptidoglycan-binding domain